MQSWFTGGSARQSLFYARADNAEAAFSAPRTLSPDRQRARPLVLATAKCRNGQKHRSLDSLNCRWSTVRSLGADAEGDWLPGRGGWPAGRHFQGAKGEKNARRFEVYGYVFSARKPS